MIGNLVETPSKPPAGERRSLTRLMPARGVIPARVTTETGQIVETLVGDVTAAGARIIGNIPAEVGDKIRMQIRFSPDAKAFAASGIVAHRTDEHMGVRITV
ncbi:MAG: hypothetical protein JSV78_04570 [Phycisphaerales bacterium]|nr:MAG: hypothetical protein JSV78_04570 [Phycisphaerales bacterium]